MTTAPQPESSADPSAGDRLKWMSKNSTRLIIALVVLVVAALVVVFSFSLFSSSSANPGNMATSGIMEQDNSKDGLAILTVEKLLPGDSGTGTVSITNVGDSDGDFTLTASNLVDTPASPAFSGVVTLVITDGTTEVYRGLLGAVETVDLGKWDAGDQHDFTFTVLFDATAGNEFQDAESTLDFTWNATQSTS
jgi:spore coat-associated protein N